MLNSSEFTLSRPVHHWLRQLHVFYSPEKTTPLLDEFARNLMEYFQKLGHFPQNFPDENTDLVLTTAPFGVALNWRKAYLFTVRKRFKLRHTPAIYSIIHATNHQFQESLDYFARVLAKEPPDPKDYEFPGLSPRAFRTLFEQGRRGGPILALARLLQSQSKSIRIILLVGDDELDAAYLFDLVGAHPRIEASDPDFFYSDIVLRLATTLSTREVTAHQVIEPPVSQQQWQRLTTPAAMQRAAIELGKRNFFTEMVRITDLVHVPAVADTVAQQYSEGCFATWDPQINALIATITGSARPVEKDQISEDDLAVIVGVREDGSGAIIRHVEGKRNDPPSSEAVEMMDMDSRLPQITLGAGWEHPGQVPVVRSKLHGHRGIGGYDPALVEFAPLDPPYYAYPVSCATEAQAQGIVRAFGRAAALRNPDDPRKLVFTVLPGHGIVIAEKWVPGAEPFQIIYEAMDSGALLIENHIPQGEVRYRPDKTGFMLLQ